MIEIAWVEINTTGFVQNMYVVSVFQFNQTEDNNSLFF